MRAKNLLSVLLVSGASALGGCRAPETELLTPLAVVNWYPSGSASCVSRDTAVWITFSSPVVESSFKTLETAAGTPTSPGLFGPDPVNPSEEAPVPVTRTYEPSTATVKLEPTVSLAFDTSYAIRLDAGIEAEDGGRLTIAISSSFRTVLQSGCAVGPACKVDADCAPKRCSVTGACVTQCAVPDDCPAGFVCNADTCQ